MLTYSYIRLNGELVDYEPSELEEMIEQSCYVDDDYYMSLYELQDVMDPTEIAKESVSSHQAVKTIKKSNKKKSMEQRAKQKRVHRIDAIPELSDE